MIRVALPPVRGPLRHDKLVYNHPQRLLAGHTRRPAKFIALPHIAQCKPLGSDFGPDGDDLATLLSRPDLARQLQVKPDRLGLTLGLSLGFEIPSLTRLAGRMPTDAPTFFLSMHEYLREGDFHNAEGTSTVTYSVATSSPLLAVEHRLYSATSKPQLRPRGGCRYLADGSVRQVFQWLLGG